MNIFILRDEGEIGPFTWVEVFLMLNQGELDGDLSARIGEESKTLAEWGLWDEGAEVGPLDWDEISTLLQTGIVSLDAPAKFEGAKEFSSLGEVIRQSHEVCLDVTGMERGDFLGCLLPFSCEAFSLRRGAVAACTGAMLLLAGAGIFLILNTRPAVSAQIAKSDAASTSARFLSFVTPAPAKEFLVAAPESSAPQDPLVISTNSSQPASVEVPAVIVETLPAEAAKVAPEVPATSAAANTVATQVEVPDATSPVPDSRPAMPQKAPEPAVAARATPAPSPSAQTARATQTASVSRPQPASEAAAPMVGDFFKIQSVKLLKKVPKDGFGVWLFSNDKKRNFPVEFQPCLEITAAAKDNIRSENLIAKVYFFNENNKLIASLASPSKAGAQDKNRHHEMPVLFYKDKADRVYFQVPEKIGDSRWKAVVVFGDKDEAQSACFPPTESDYLLDYAEKKLVYNRNVQRVARRAAMDPLIEHVVKTRNPKMPQITLFLRPPAGISDASEVQGVLAICVLANSLEEMKRELRKEEMPGDYRGLFSFANKNKLAIVAWGSRRLWDPGKNYDDLSREQARNIDESLDIVTNAWERGIKELGEKYGIPQKDFLLWGNCGSAQWAQRLCLRKPQYFLATYIHMPGSYDKPTPEAANVLWCLTIGELEGGYERSKRWVKTVREMGYPIVYKAIPGLGHAGHPDAAALGFEFYNFALEQKKVRQEAQKENPNSAPSLIAHTDTPWSTLFQNPPFYGDMVNQELHPSTEVAMIPAGFRIPLPTKRLADIWIRNK